MDLLNNSNTILGIIASCLTIVAIVIPVLGHHRKNEQSVPPSPTTHPEPVSFVSRFLAAIFGLIAGIIVFAIALILLSFIVNLILGNRLIFNWFVIFLNVFVFLLSTLLGIFFAIAMGKQYLDFQLRVQRHRLEFEESRRKNEMEFEESRRRQQMEMEEFRHKFNNPWNSKENRPDSQV